MNDNETIQIHLNSKYATSYNNNSSSDCNFTLPNIEVQDGYYIHLSIINCVIPYSFYNIDSTNNGLFYQEILVDANGNQTGTINTTVYFNTSGGVIVRLGSIDRFETYRLGPPLIDRFSAYRLTPIDRLKSID